MTLAESLLQTFPEAHLRQILFLYAMVALSTAMCLTVLEKFRLPAEESLTRIAPDILLLVFGGVIIVAFCFTTGNHQFGGYDLSSVIDLGWRQYLGQRPYRDFVCTVPIGYVLAVGAAFRIGGPLWNSLVLGSAFLGLVSWGWNYALIRRLTRSRSVAILLSSTLVCCSVFVYGHLFHSLMTAVGGQVLILSAMCFSRNIPSRGIDISLAVSIGAMLLMKPNAAAPLVLGVGAVLLVGSPEKKRMAFILLAGAAGAGILLLLNHINPFEVMWSYLGVSGRAKPDKLFVELDAWDRVGVSGQLVVALIPVIFSSGLRQTSGKAENRTFVGICWVAFFVGLYSMTTNWDIKLGDLTYWILAITAYPLLTKSHRFAARAASAWCLFVFLGVGIAYGVCRTRNRHVGYGTFFEWKTLSHPVPIPFFRDLIAGSNLHRVVRESMDAVSLLPDRSVFFGPCMEFLYAALKIEPPRGLPIWWHPGSSYPLDQEPEIDSRWSQLEFGTLIFLRGNFTRIPLAIQNSISRDYEQCAGFPDLSVFVRRKALKRPPTTAKPLRNDEGLDARIRHRIHE